MDTQTFPKLNESVALFYLFIPLALLISCPVLYFRPDPLYIRNVISPTAWPRIVSFHSKQYSTQTRSVWPSLLAQISVASTTSELCQTPP